MSEVELAKLHAAVESLGREFNRRMDRQDATLLEIRADVKATNGTVIRHDENLKTHGEHIRTLQQAAQMAAAHVSSKPHGSGVADEPTKLRDELKWYLACAGGGGGAVLWVLKLMGKL